MSKALYIPHKSLASSTNKKRGMPFFTCFATSQSCPNQLIDLSFRIFRKVAPFGHEQITPSVWPLNSDISPWNRTNLLTELRSTSAQQAQHRRKVSQHHRVLTANIQSNSAWRSYLPMDSCTGRIMELSHQLPPTIISGSFWFTCILWIVSSQQECILTHSQSMPEHLKQLLRDGVLGLLTRLFYRRSFI